MINKGYKMKECKDCNNTKPFSEFHPRTKSRWEKYKDSPAGYQPHCKDCHNQRRRDYYKGNADKRKDTDRNYRLKHTYGIDLQEYNQMFKEQGGVCKICETNPDKRNLCVDHCHQTGKVRGLLCVPCNLALGYMKDDINLFERAIKYLT